MIPLIGILKLLLLMAFVWGANQALAGVGSDYKNTNPILERFDSLVYHRMDSVIMTYRK